MSDLKAFLLESNKIEGIRGLSSRCVEAAQEFLELPRLTVGDISVFVQRNQPGARLRDQPHLNVRVGDHIPPRGGQAIVAELHDLLDAIHSREVSPWAAHVRYETLHPYTDGNGRSGRIIWLWMHYRNGGTCPLGFLHHFYYETLSSRRSTGDAS